MPKYPRKKRGANYFQPGYKKRKRTKGKSVIRARPAKVSYEAKYDSQMMRALANARTGGFLGIENKFFDTGVVNKTLNGNAAWNGHEMDPAATESCLNAIAQGDGQSNRDGKQVRLTSVYVTGQVIRAISSGVSAAAHGGTVFLALVLDTQTNGAQLNSEDVYINPAANAITTAIPLRNLQYTSRFKVLKTLVIPFDAPNGYTESPNAGGAGTGDYDIGGCSRTFQWYCKLDLPVNFTGNTSDIANIMDNSLHIVGTSELASTSSMLLSYNARVRFVG